MKNRLFTFLILSIILALLLPTVSIRAKNAVFNSTPHVPTHRVMHYAEPRSQNVEFVTQMGGASTAVAVQGDYAYVGIGPSLFILDISDPAQVSVVSQAEPLLDDISDIVIKGNYVYLTDDRGGGLHVFDVSDRAHPRQIGMYSLSPAWDLVVEGNYAYINAYGYMYIVDVSDPAHPAYVGKYSKGGIVALAVSGSYAYVDSTNNLYIVDISNPANPQFVKQWGTLAWDPTDIALSGGFAYLSDHDRGLIKVSISDPLNPHEVDSHSADYGTVAVSGGYVYAANQGSVLVFDASDLDASIKSFNTPVGVTSIATTASYLYVADRYYGLRIMDLNAVTPTEVGFFDVPGYVQGVALKKPYALLAQDSRGLFIADVSDLTETAKVGSYDTPGASYNVSVSRNYAYVADGDNGLRIIDVSDPSIPIEVGFYNTGGTANDVMVVGSYALVADGDSGMRIVDITDPAHPIETGGYDIPGLASASKLDVTGNLAYVAFGSGDLRILNVSDPAHPALVGIYEPSGGVYDVAVVGNYAYVATTFDFHIANISDPSQPVEVGSCGVRGGTIRDVEVVQNLAFVAVDPSFDDDLKRVGGGLRVIDAIDRANPVEVGYYLAMSANDLSLDGRFVYVADKEGGLLVLRYTGAISSNLFLPLVQD